MKLSMLEKRLLEWTAQATEREVDEHALDMPLDELGVDSLMALELAVHVEREFGIRLNEDDLAGIRSLRDIQSFDRTGT